ncbi:hypothetical protein FLA_5515 [Filimonas lacunae]|nr:hypothetical protein FLA_5515 [Filimonas lacunae]
MFCYFASHLTEEKWTTIGEFINTDHATAIRGAKKISDYLDTADDITIEKVKRVYHYFQILNNSMEAHANKRYAAVC